MKIVIIGGVAGGMSAATRLRRLMEDAEIVVMEKRPFLFHFANCGFALLRFWRNRRKRATACSNTRSVKGTV